ncbi:hypothetical protein A3Q56_01055 [Intoshia linei]|uniref:Uncharacterized protein n=1 Tax=Intoshia linei TaxID=1819745 RepID=A0A177BAG7_9BILA|nr:hypothetical protein A3Q56_01055 [Intoshia linei]
MKFKPCSCPIDKKTKEMHKYIFVIGYL